MKGHNPRMHFEVAHDEAWKGGQPRHFSTAGAAMKVAERIAYKHPGAKIIVMKIDSHGDAFIWSSVTGPKANPHGSILFRTRAAALKYARKHGAKRFSIKKLKAGR